MNDLVALFLVILWVAFFAYWWIPALWNRTTVKRISPRGSFLFCTIVPIAAIMIVFSLFAPWLYDYRVLPDTLPVAVAGLLVMLPGLGFAIRARQHLGTNWSARPAIREHHTLTRTGPYAIVRHPIYTGLLTGILGTAIATGYLMAFISIIVALVMLLFKIRIEERFMLDEFGGEYERYRREVKALIPYVL
jgi:protein-S-isoprenylcysteine O-methyltransferase Ste14